MLIGGATLAIVAISGEETGASVRPARSGEVSVSGPALTEPLSTGDSIPAFSAPAIGGGSVRWAEYADGPVLLAVWAPWCPHCQAELPVLARVMRDYPGVSFLTAVTSIDDHPGPDAGAFLRDHGIQAPTAIDDAEGTLAGALGVRGFPTLFFVDGAGSVVRAMEGEVDESTLRAALESLR